MAADPGDTDALIGRLATGAGPVRRLRPPFVRATIWLAIAVALLTAGLALFGLRDDLAVALREPGAAVSLAAAIATGLAAAIAAFHLAIPGRSPRWALLPLAPAVVWASGLSVGCYADWVRFGAVGPVFGHSVECFIVIVAMSLLAGLPLAWMLRTARFANPIATGALGGLAVATLSSVAVELSHETDARIMDVLWHLAAVGIVVTISTRAAKRLTRQPVTL